MNKIKIQTRTELINLSAPVEVGAFKADLIAQVIVCGKEKTIDVIEFIDIENPSYNGTKISDYRMFKKMNKEWGMDYDAILDEKFDEIFEEKVVKEILGMGEN